MDTITTKEEHHDLTQAFKVIKSLLNERRAGPQNASQNNRQSSAQISTVLCRILSIDKDTEFVK